MGAGDFFARLGGGDLELLATSSSNSRDRFLQMGLVLTFTSAVAGVSMWFALHSAVGVPSVQAVLVSSGWALLILNLDRLLIITMNAGGSIARLLMLAFPRLVLAFIIGAVVSTPLTLRLFENDINFQLGQMSNAAGEVNKDAVAKSPQQKRVDDLTADLKQQRAIRNGVLPESADSAEVKSLEKQLKDLQIQQKTAQHKSDQADILVQCERYGGQRQELDDPGKCAAKPGPNGNYSRYLREAQQAAKELDAVNSKVTSKEQAIGQAQGAQQAATKDQLKELQRQAPGKIAEIEGALAVAQKELKARRDQLNGESANNRGLLARLEALAQVTKQNSTLDLAHKLLWALFTAIELLPVLVKVLSAFGPRTAYDESVSLRDSAEVDAARMGRAATNQIEKGRIDARVKSEDDMRQHEVALAKEGNKQVATVMKTVMEDSLSAWQTQVSAALRSRGAGQPQAPPSGAGDTAGSPPPGSNGSGPQAQPQPQSQTTSSQYILPPTSSLGAP